MSELKTCPNCKSPYGYPTGNLFMCPEWDPEAVVEETGLVIKDANGNLLQDGDSVVVIKPPC